MRSNLDSKVQETAVPASSSSGPAGSSISDVADASARALGVHKHGLNCRQGTDIAPHAFITGMAEGGGPLVLALPSESTTVAGPK